MNRKVRKTIFRILIGISAFLLLFILIIIGASLFCRHEPSQPDTAEWRTGMVFFSVGDGWESAAVRSITGLFNLAVSDSTPSHCGIVTRGERGPLLFHASTVAKRVVVETPEEYIANNGSYCLYVKPMAFEIDTVKLKSDIDSLLSKQVPFDFEFDHSDDSSLYCTELVVLLHELNGCDTLSSLRNNHYIYPQDILDFMNAKKRRF